MQCHLARHPVAGTAQRDELWLFEEQLRRWSEQGLDFEQRREVSRLRQVIAEILAAGGGSEARHYRGSAVQG